MTEPKPAENQPECNGNCGTSKTADRKAKDMDCAQLRDKMQELTDKEKIGRVGTKGLLQRFRDYKGDDATHGPQILDQQRSLRSYMNAYKDKGCGDPPAQSKELADRPLTAPQSEGITGTDVAKVVGTVGLGYVAYRALRMLPSLFPPLWETIPANLAVP